MVITLDFGSKNIGSIPIKPTICTFNLNFNFTHNFNYVIFGVA